jgi:hypothetical protein
MPTYTRTLSLSRLLYFLHCHQYACHPHLWHAQGLGERTIVMFLKKRAEDGNPAREPTTILKVCVRVRVCAHDDTQAPPPPPPSPHTLIVRNERFRLQITGTSQIGTLAGCIAQKIRGGEVHRC